MGTVSWCLWVVSDPSGAEGVDMKHLLGLCGTERAIPVSGNSRRMSGCYRECVILERDSVIVIWNRETALVDKKNDDDMILLLCEMANDLHVAVVKVCNT